MRSTALLSICLLAGCAGAGSPRDTGNLSPQEMATRSSAELCEAFNGLVLAGEKQRARLRAELERRQALTASEWKLIERDQVRTGMSDLALICSWGYPSSGDHTSADHWVYRRCGGNCNRHVYTENGVVTSWQD